MTCGRRSILPVAVVSTALLLTACGSTVQRTAATAPGAGGAVLSDDGLSTTDGAGVDPAAPVAAGSGAGSGSAGTGTALDGSGGAGESAGPGAPGGSAGGAAPGTAGEPGATGAGAASGRGVTASEIRIGFVISSGASDVAASVGAESLVGGDHKAEVNAIVRNLNARGGILGRKVVPLYQEVDAAQEQSDPAAAAQSACSGLTQDKKVFAAMSYVANINNDVMFQCMHKAKTPYLATDLSSHTHRSYAGYAPHVYAPHTLVVDRLAPALVSRLAAQKYFTGWDTAAGGPGRAPVKVGVLHSDQDDTYLRKTRQALSAAGVGSPSTFAYRGSLDTISSDMSAAVLRFRSDGVTHVLLETAAPMLFFLPNAENQGYRPRYGFSSLNGPAAHLETGAIPARQFVGSLGAGYAPLTDVGAQQTSLSTAEDACRKIMKEAGQDTSSATAFFYMVVACDGFDLIAQALARSGSATSAGLRAGIDALGGSFTSAAVAAMGWQPNRYDGVAGVRDFHFQDGRFSYTGGLHGV